MKIKLQTCSAKGKLFNWNMKKKVSANTDHYCRCSLLTLFLSLRQKKIKF